MEGHRRHGVCEECAREAKQCAYCKNKKYLNGFVGCPGYGASWQQPHCETKHALPRRGHVPCKQRLCDVAYRLPVTLKDLADWRWQQTLRHTRTHGGLKSGDSTFAVYRHMSEQVRQNLVNCNASALAMAGYEGNISELDMSPQNISFLCLVGSIFYVW